MWEEMCEERAVYFIKRAMELGKRVEGGRGEGGWAPSENWRNFWDGVGGGLNCWIGLAPFVQENVKLTTGTPEGDCWALGLRLDEVSPVSIGWTWQPTQRIEEWEATVRRLEDREGPARVVIGVPRTEDRITSRLRALAGTNGWRTWKVWEDKKPGGWRLEGWTGTRGGRRDGWWNKVEVEWWVVERGEGEGGWDWKRFNSSGQCHGLREGGRELGGHHRRSGRCWEAERSEWRRRRTGGRS